MKLRLVSVAVRKFVSFNRRLSKVLDKKFPNFFGRTRNHHKDLKHHINELVQIKKGCRVLEVGGVDRPLLDKGEHFHYTGLDIEWRSDCDFLYDEFITQSITSPISKKFDLIISNTLFEHVEDNTKSFNVMFDALNEDGFMLHYIPSKNQFYSILTRMVGPTLQNLLIRYLRPNAMKGTGYRTYFDRCSPNEMESLCKKVGFCDVQIVPYYRATDYFAFFLPFYICVAVFEKIFEKFGWKYFACGMKIYASKIAKQSF